MKYGAIDAHRSYSQVCILDKSTGVLEDFRIASTPEAMWDMAGVFGDCDRVALEASSHWGWMVDELQEMGLDVVLSHPTKTKAIGAAKIKTDKIDARMLAYLLSSDLLPEAHIASPEVRELRGFLRYRLVLVKMRTMAKNRVHSVLAGYGLMPPCSDLFCKKGRRWLSEQRLGELAAHQVEGYLTLIDHISSLVASVDERIKPMAQMNNEAQLLTTIPGIGHYGALLIAAEIDGVERFGSAKQLVSYAGLCPTTRSSGGKDRHGHITRCGSRFLRWILVEAAQKAVFPHSILHPFYWSVARRKGSGTAKVATARKLLESIYQMLRKHEGFHPDAWTKPSRGVASGEA